MLLTAFPLAGPSGAASGTPAPVSAVTITGTDRPLEATVAWTPAVDAGSGGARVVVMAGASPTTDARDPAALLSTDVPSPATSTTWVGGSAGQVYSVSVFAYATPGGPFAAPATSRVRLPRRVSHLVIDNYRNYRYTAFWALEANAGSAVLCYRRGAAPPSPAEASQCAPAAPYYAELIPTGGTFADPALTSDFVAFSRDSRTGVLGPGAIVSGETPPPFPAVALTGRAVTGRSLKLSWWDASFGAQGGYPYPDRGGTREWLVFRRPGLASPASQSAAEPVATVQAQTYRTVARISGLRKNATYTFAVRGRDADGHLSDWSDPYTTEARRPGFSVVDDASPSHRWRVPRSRGSVAGSLASGSRGRVFVNGSTGSDKVRSAWRDPKGRWRTSRTAAAGATGLSVNSSGVLAASSYWCVTVRRPGRPWRKSFCPPNLSNAGVFSPVVDERGRVHVLVEQSTRSAHRVGYASNASGSWRVVPLDIPPGTNDPLLAYDRKRDLLALVVMLSPEERLEVRVATKRPKARRFGRLRPWYVPAPDARLLLLNSVTVAGGRLTLAATGIEWGVGPSGPPALLAGTVREAARVTRIRGTSVDDVPIVSAGSRRVVKVAWTRGTRTLANPRQGVWSTTARWRPGRGDWAMTAPAHRTRSAYDRVVDLDTVGGRAYLLVRTGATENERQLPG